VNRKARVMARRVARERERRLTVCASAGDGKRRKIEPRIASRGRYPMMRPRMIHTTQIMANPLVSRLGPSWAKREYRVEVVGMGDGGSRAWIACKSESVRSRASDVVGVCTVGGLGEV
jgi:hypothetical protein